MRTAVLVIAILLAHAALLAYSATTHSPTIDEPGHLVAGLVHWEFGRFDVYKVNPPLVHYIAALPVIAAGYEADWSEFYDHPGARPEFSMGSAFIRANGERAIWLFTLARWACIPFSLVGGLFCFLWSRELWSSDLAGLVSLTLWCFEPNILAHGELITCDCAAASFGLGAGYYFWRWLRIPTWSRATTAGLTLGLALLTKTVWIILFGLWPVLWLFWRATFRFQISNLESSPQPSPPATHHLPLSSFAQLAALLLLGLYLLNVGYVFDGTFTRLKDYTFISNALTAKEERRTPGNRFADSWLGQLPVPLPKPFVEGIDVQKSDFEGMHANYLRGEWRSGRGWWYYYLYGLAVKTPHGTQFLLLMAIVLMILRSDKHSHAHGLQPVGVRDIVMLLTPAVAVLVLVSAEHRMNAHVRYVLPVLGFLFVFIGSVAVTRSASSQSRVHITPG
ncbi:MAG: phospholipid carrier-dependent glycosyltransferase [Planctomycetaceae bacterium]|nr:phospholipid carrier-dependent glycosyltransferase [Planctomycetaceae bacterium]